MTAAQPFEFLDAGPLIDDELELVQPHTRWLDDLLAACHHPRTQRDSPAEARWTRVELEDYLRAAPGGRVQPDARRGRVPQYDFWMLRRADRRSLAGLFLPPVRIMGGITLRVSHAESVERYYGHIGYHVFPAARGRHYALRSCRLLLPLALRHGLNPLWITCDPQNIPSCRTCDRLGMKLAETVDVPADEPLFARGERVKRRYRLDL